MTEWHCVMLKIPELYRHLVHLTLITEKTVDTSCSQQCAFPNQACDPERPQTVPRLRSELCCASMDFISKCFCSKHILTRLNEFHTISVLMWKISRQNLVTAFKIFFLFSGLNCIFGFALQRFSPSCRTVYMNWKVMRRSDFSFGHVVVDEAHNKPPTHPRLTPEMGQLQKSDRWEYLVKLALF